jgi:hypothetical protein
MSFVRCLSPVSVLLKRNARAPGRVIFGDRTGLGKPMAMSCGATWSSDVTVLSQYLYLSAPRGQTSLYSSSAAQQHDYELEQGNNELAPRGDLFEIHTKAGQCLMSKFASIRRTFGPNSNSTALLTCGGPSLARYASFDPQYDRARSWIHSHPVGTAVVGPILIQGLIGALVEATFPQGVTIRSEMEQLTPLIVGVECEARITVTHVEETNETSSCNTTKGAGHEVTLSTYCATVRDGALVSKGTYIIWIPDVNGMQDGSC